MNEKEQVIALSPTFVYLSAIKSTKTQVHNVNECLKESLI